jgi:hypothetical protein
MSNPNEITADEYQKKYAKHPSTDFPAPNYRRVKPQYCIGIDPDKDKSGFAIYDRRQAKFTRFESLEAFPLHQACTSHLTNECEFFVEAGWLNKGMNKYQKENLPAAYHNYPPERQWAFWFDRGTDVGINFGIGHFIIALLRAMGYTVFLYQPKSAKWKAEQLKSITGITARTNQDTRDAIRAAYYSR